MHTLLLLWYTCRISELVERETEENHKADPDPFDDRHPGELELYVTPEGEHQHFLERKLQVHLVHVFFLRH